VQSDCRFVPIGGIGSIYANTSSALPWWSKLRFAVTDFSTRRDRLGPAYANGDEGFARSRARSCARSRDLAGRAVYAGEVRRAVPVVSLRGGHPATARGKIGTMTALDKGGRGRIVRQVPIPDITPLIRSPRRRRVIPDRWSTVSS
jgi:hypothetical protein